MKQLKNGGLKLLISGLITIITLPCVVYYISKYYIQGSISFEKSLISGFTLICSLLILGVILGVYNAYQNYQLKKENLQLEKIIFDLSNKVDNYHFDNLEYQNGTRELILDSETTEVE